MDEEIQRGDKYVIRLWDIQTPSIIVESPTGVIYTNQCGGTMCSQPELEGFLVPLRYFDESAVYQILGDFWFTPDDPVWHRVIKKKLPQLRPIVEGDYSTRINGSMQLDQKRAYTIEWGEAWVPVMSDYGPGILTWENSD